MGATTVSCKQLDKRIWVNWMLVPEYEFEGETVPTHWECVATCRATNKQEYGLLMHNTTWDTDGGVPELTDREIKQLNEAFEETWNKMDLEWVVPVDYQEKNDG